MSVTVQLNLKTDFIVHLPYNLTLEDLKLEGGTEDVDLEDQLGWLYDNANSDEVLRITTAANILYNTLVPTPSYPSCLATAIVWERG